MARSPRLLLFSALFSLFALPHDASAHGASLSVRPISAVRLEATDHGGDPIAGAAWSIHAIDAEGRASDAAANRGTTDADGAFVFLPDRKGEWRVRVAATDGHGLDETIRTGSPEITASRAESEAGAPGPSRIVLGISVLFGIFGLVTLFTRGRA